MGIKTPDSQPAILVNNAPHTPPTAFSFKRLPNNKPVPTKNNEVTAVILIAKRILICISSPNAPAANKVIAACTIVITSIGNVYPKIKSGAVIGEVNKRIKKEEVRSFDHNIPANSAINTLPNIAKPGAS